MSLHNRYLIAIPGGSCTGGPEALHQLCAMMRKEGMDAAVLYFGGRNQRFIDAYGAVYGNPEFASDPDASAMLIVPETEDPVAWRAKGWTNLCVWWLSSTRIHTMEHYVGTYHCFQSFHARQQCGLFSIKGLMLTDYLGEPTSTGGADIPDRTNVALVNHRSSHWIKPLSKALPNVEIRVLAGMSPSRVAAEMRSAKVYVDLGSHPGRDRMPREAALAGCAVVVGCFGSAKGDDIPIPASFKLADLRIENVIVAIKSALAEYDRTRPLFEDYRRWILEQKEQFRREVAQLPSFFDSAPESPNFDNEAMDNAWVALQRELHELRGGLSRTGVFEAMCIQAAGLRISAWRYLLGKAGGWLRKKPHQ